ncbi:MAG: hypothetical protein JO317_04125, partial [Verrucomicrobiae bacterium]|nr:hypothetical protein [Verrucomicrobiae bacterium]
MRVFVLLFASAAALLTGCSPRKAPGSSASHWNLDGSEPHLVAHYMPWYEVRPPAETSWWPWSTRTPDVRTWRHWKWEDGGPVRDPEHRRADGRRDIASVQYPLIGPYDSRSREVIRYHLLTAKAAGIQAFLVDWYGPGSFEDKPMRILLDEAEDCGMKIAVCYEEKIHFPQSFGPSSRPEAVEREIKDLRYILDEYGDSAAYLTRDGLPFIMQFNSVGQSPIGAAYLNPQETRQVMEALRGRMVFARQNLDEPYHPPVPGSFHWWSPDQPEIARYTERCRNLRQAGRLQFFMSM